MTGAHLLVTGASGYLGSHLSRALLATGHRLTLLKRPGSQFSPQLLANPAVRLFDLEKDDLATIFRQSEPIALVLHLATCYGKHGESPIEILEANFHFPTRLLETAMEAGVRGFLNTDTYFNTLAQGGPALNDYALSKGLFLAWGRHQAEQRHFPFINLRLEHLYGPGDSQDKFVNRAVRQLLNNPAHLPLTAGDQERDFIHVDDVVAAYLCLINNRASFPPGLTEVGVGSGNAINLRGFMTCLKQLCGATTELDFSALPHRPNEIMASQANLQVLSALGWQPRVSLEAGLQQLILHEQSILPGSQPCTF